MTWKFHQSLWHLLKLESFHKWRYLSFLLLDFKIESFRIILLNAFTSRVKSILILDFLLHFHPKTCWKWSCSWFDCNHGQLPSVMWCITFLWFSWFWRGLQVFFFVLGRALEDQHWSMACCRCKIHIELCCQQRFFARMHFSLFRRIFLDLKHQNRNKFFWFC